jgi:hypothetical protein
MDVHASSSNHSTFREDFIRFLYDIQTKHPWFVHLVFWAVAQYVRGDHDLLNRDDCDATLKQILKDLACTLTPFAYGPLPDTLAKSAIQWPYNFIQYPIDDILLKEYRDPSHDLDSISYFILHAYNIVSYTDTNNLIIFIRWIIHQKVLDLNSISFALRTLWIPIYIMSLYEERRYNDNVVNGNHTDLVYNTFHTVFHGLFNRWYHGFYPEEYVPSGCDPLRILHDRFPE